MGDITKIQWADHTINPVIGCDEAKDPDGNQHPACDGCYAREGFGTMLGGRWGDLAEGGVRRVTSDDNWRKPLKWARAAGKANERRRVFCASLADVLDLEWPKGTHTRLWDLIRRTANVDPWGNMRDWTQPLEFGLDWLLLTKRPERWRLIPDDVRPLVWLGTSISDQHTADIWVPRLLEAEGFRCRFVSAEPLLGPVKLRATWTRGVFGGARASIPGIDWLIIGGESGSRGWDARPYPMLAAFDLISQCKSAGIPAFHKQLGEKPFDQDGPWRVTGKGGDPAEWPEPLRVREFPKFRPAPPAERAGP